MTDLVFTAAISFTAGVAVAVVYAANRDAHDAGMLRASRDLALGAYFRQCDLHDGDLVRRDREIDRLERTVASLERERDGALGEAA